MKVLKLIKTFIINIAKCLGVALAASLSVFIIFQTVSVIINNEVQNENINIFSKINLIKDYPEEYKIIYRAAADNALYSNTIVNAELVEDDGYNCVFEVKRIYYSENSGVNSEGEKQNPKFTKLEVGHRITVPISSEYKEPSAFSKLFNNNEYVNKYWYRGNLLCELEVNKTYTLLLSKEDYFGEPKGEHKATLIFMVSADSPRGSIKGILDGKYDANYFDPVYEEVGYYAECAKRMFRNIKKEYTASN